MKTLVTCVDCLGTGEWSLGSHSCRCHTCEGSGKITEPERHMWRLKNNTYNSMTIILYSPDKRYLNNKFFDLE